MTNANDTASQGLRYTERGWAVVQLHDVAGGLCSCGSADPEHAAAQGGKHPVGKGWQNAGLRTAAAVADAWARRPGANIGIVTGRASGIWVLDVDPLHGGDKQLAALVAAYGPLPETYTVRTGSGGRHYYWLMPDFDFTTSRGQLPLGLDVRGNAGQVVAPPSYTLRGSYAVLVDVPVVAAPAWLLGLIRPVERPEPVDRGPAGEAWTMPSAAVGRGAGYAAVAVREVLGQLAGAQPGERNVTAYRVGRRLAELIASPWAGLDPDAVWAAYLDAAARCDVDGGFSQSEAAVVLTRAVRDQGGRGVDLPAPDHLGTRTDWVPPPSDFDQAGQDPANPFSSPGTRLTSIDVAGQLINGPAEQGEDVEPYEMEVRKALHWLRVQRDAKERLRSLEAVWTDFGQVALDDAGMAGLTEAIPLVADWIDQDCLARVNGPSGHGKSFVVLDMAACVSTATSWHGRAVTQVKVCYVVAEGARGMARRAQAWCQRHDLDSTGIVFVPRPVQITGVEWEAFKVWCIREQFGLIIFDTQARNAMESDENDATEMGMIVAGLDEVRTATGACAMLVHHRGLRGEHGRGSSAMRGALDIELDVSRQGSTVTLKSTKQKDRADPEPLRFAMNPLGESLVLVAERDATGPFTSPVVPVSLRERCAMAIAYALLDASGSGLTRSEAQAHARVALGLGADESTRRTVRRAWADLIGLGRIAKAAGREAHFFIDLEGATIMQANPDKAVQGGPEVYEG